MTFAVFLDLDGTLVDSRPGIVSSLVHALTVTGHLELAASDLTWMIGPPFAESFAKAGIADPATAIEAYRVKYQEAGMFDAQVYAGIPEAMDAICLAGARLYLATAKPHAYARLITAHFGLAPRFIAEYGPELDGTRNWKGDLLAHALSETGEDPARSVMIGDRHHDVAAAAEVGMPSLAVGWGYGTAAEWQGARAILERPDQMPEAVAQLFA